MSTLASTPFHEGCAICGTHHTVSLDNELIEAARSRDLVIFAGAGISTEAPGRFPETFYEEIEAQLRDAPSGDPFPDVMQEFERRFGRKRLVGSMLERIEYVSTFLSLQRRTTAFHEEIATISQLDAIFTTNWDDFFERFSGARPFVLDEDFAFFALPGRRVMKVHGSVSNLSTLVATADDYARRESDLAGSVMGAKLREFLSTKVIVFVGFSLTDSDFLSIYWSVIERMGAFRPRAYVVTPVDSPTATAFGLKHLKTDGGHFAHQLKARLQESGDHIPDSRLDRAAWFQQVVLSAHTPSALLLEKPNNFAVFTQAYQDGLLAALGRVGLMRHKGAYSEPRAVSDIVHTYGHLFDKAIGLRRYFDASYIEGYMAATKSLLLSDDDALKLPIVQAFACPSYRKTKRDAHDEVDFPWWIQSPHGAIGSYLEQGDTLGRVPTEWLVDLDERSRTLARRTPGLVAENASMLRGLKPGQIPQHSEFLDGI